MDLHISQPEAGAAAVTSIVHDAQWSVVNKAMGGTNEIGLEKREKRVRSVAIQLSYKELS